MGSVLHVAKGFSPLDEELALLPGGLTPSLAEHLVHLAAWMPFAPAARMLKRLLRVEVSEATVRRRTEQAGAAYVSIQTAEVERLEKESPPVPEGPALQQMSVDGAFVPVVGGEWAEVKTLAIGTITESVGKEGEKEVHTRDLSYFSRLAEHESFGRLATVETQRRGTERAGKVAAVVDGADWEQGFIDLHRPDAVRILDWGHASEYVAKAGQAVFGAGTATVSEWLSGSLHELRHGDPEVVLKELRVLRDQEAAAGESAALGVVTGSLAYLEKRREQIRYAEFAAQGYPIGSGAVESANKLVIQARLKGAGMHWAREQVNPMVALRNIVCNDRWEEGWSQVHTRLRQATRERSREHRTRRQAPTADVSSAVSEETTAPPYQVVTAEPITDGPIGRRPTIVNGRPTAEHPWKKYSIFHSRRQTSARN